jgi:hypothetical protein
MTACFFDFAGANADLFSKAYLGYGVKQPAIRLRLWNRVRCRASSAGICSIAAKPQGIGEPMQRCFARMKPGREPDGR